MAETVGIREIRQNLSVYLKKVAKGKSYLITDRSVPVAELVPAAGSDSSLGRLVKEGRATRPVGDLLDIKPAKAASKDGEELTLSETLIQDRNDRDL